MEWGAITWKGIVNFLEMLTSCLLAYRLFHGDTWSYRRPAVSEAGARKLPQSVLLLVFACIGTVLLMIWEKNPYPAVDCIPALLIFYGYSRLSCRAKPWLAVLFALFNYLLIGVASLSAHAIMGIAGIGQNALSSVLQIPVTVSPFFTRLLQMLLSELVIRIKRWIMPTGEKTGYILFLFNTASLAILFAMWRLPYSGTEEFYAVLRLIICVFVLFFNFMILIFYELVVKEKKEKQDLLLQNRIAQMQISSQKEISDIYLELRGLKHDMNNHLYTLSGYLRSGNIAQAEAYIDQLTGSINELETYQSGNCTLDALIGSKSFLAKKEGIRIEAELDVSDRMTIQDEHLVTIIGNLYENAIEACRKVESGDRLIRIRIRQIREDLVIRFQNPMPEGEVFYPESEKTGKKDPENHGFGLKNIDRVVERYGGSCERTLENGMYTCRIHVPGVFSGNGL